MHIEIGAVTDVGLEREWNEDSFLLWDLSTRKPLDPDSGTDFPCGTNVLLLAVSDGMGGAQRGDLASQTTVKALQASVQGEFVDGMRVSPELGRCLERGVQAANHQVYGVTVERPELHRMGATLSAAILDGETVSIAHVGDSRIYLCRAGGLRQLTVDHTHVQNLVAMGRVDQARAHLHPQRHLLVRAIGTDESVEVEQFSQPVCEGDTVLICSDGLHSMVDESDMLTVLQAPESVLTQCQQLVELANAAGGNDNVTVVIARLVRESAV